MDFHHKIFYMLVKPKESFKDRLNFDLSLNFFVLFTLLNVIVLSSGHIKGVFSLLAIFGINHITNLFAKVLISVLLLFLLSVLCLFFLAFWLHIISKSYRAAKDYKATVEALIYSLTPLFLLALISGLSTTIYNFLLSKPIIVLIVIFYCAYILKHALVNIHKLKNGQAIAAIVLLLVYTYIIITSRIETILFYGIALILIYYFRQKLDANGPTLMYKTSLGLKLMEKASRLTRLFSVFGFLGILFGYLGMISMTIFLAYNAYELLFVPGTLPAVSLILPGVDIPGSPISTPLFYTLFAILVVVVIHEFSHGVISRLYKIPVKSSGLFFLGPITGAFVEPDDKVLNKKPYYQQLAVFAAGPFSNILFAILIVFLFGLSIPYIADQSITKHTAIVNLGEIIPELSEIESYEITYVVNGSSAYKAGLKQGMHITSIDSISVNDPKLQQHMSVMQPGQDMTITTKDSVYLLELQPHEQDPSKGQIGIGFSPIIRESEKALAKYGRFGVSMLEILSQMVFWLIIISFGIGVANLLPLGPVDGGRMLQISLYSFIKDKKKADKLWQKIAIIVLLLIFFVLTYKFFSWAGMQFIG